MIEPESLAALRPKSKSDYLNQTLSIDGLGPWLRLEEKTATAPVWPEAAAYVRVLITLSLDRRLYIEYSSDHLLR